MQLRQFFSVAIIGWMGLASCSGEEQGHSTPIDSVNTNGTAPATWGAENPANDQDTVWHNSSDTGTDVNMGPDNTDVERRNNQNVPR